MNTNSTHTTNELASANPQLLSDADLDQVSGGFFFLIAAAVALVAAESCVRDKSAH